MNDCHSLTSETRRHFTTGWKGFSWCMNLLTVDCILYSAGTVCVGLSQSQESTGEGWLGPCPHGDTCSRRARISPRQSGSMVSPGPCSGHLVTLTLSGRNAPASLKPKGTADAVESPRNPRLQYLESLSRKLPACSRGWAASGMGTAGRGMGYLCAWGWMCWIMTGWMNFRLRW